MFSNVPDFVWVLVLGSILITPLLPSLLRAKCPACNRRKLNSIDTIKLPTEAGAFTYIALSRCDSCHQSFKQEKSGPVEQCTAIEHDELKKASAESATPTAS